MGLYASLENDISLRGEERLDPLAAIGTRMPLQLLPAEELQDIIRCYEQMNRLFIVRLVAKVHKVDLKDVTVILVIDGLQNIVSSKTDGLNECS